VGIENSLTAGDRKGGGTRKREGRGREVKI